MGRGLRYGCPYQEEGPWGRERVKSLDLADPGCCPPISMWGWWASEGMAPLLPEQGADPLLRGMGRADSAGTLWVLLLSVARALHTAGRTQV